MKCLLSFLFALALTCVVQAAEKIRIACIGDSITYGYALANPAVDAYPAQLQKLLDADQPGRYEVRNFGNSGRGIYLDTKRGNAMRGYRWQKEHKDALAFAPDIVICNLGINDIYDHVEERTGVRKQGEFVTDYLTLLGDYAKLPKKPKFYIWTKLAPLTSKHRAYRSPEPLLMQRDLDEVARRAHAVGIDMAEPLRGNMDAWFGKDGIHPDPAGARVIAETTRMVLKAPAKESVVLPKTATKGEVWLCAGQSNMQTGWANYMRTPEEKARGERELADLARHEIWFWDFNDGTWRRLTAQNARAKCAYGVSFALRRARATKKSVCLVYVAAGGAPTESFLSESTMCAYGSDGQPRYPRLTAIATNRHSLEANADFPCVWCAREYPRRKNNREEARWWPVAAMYDAGIARVRHLPFTGILWYQGESNATTGASPDVPTDEAYMRETLRAVVAELRGAKKIPFLMMGLPKMNRPWDAYREAQRTVCNETGAVYIDSFGAGLGDANDVHPRDKAAFADLAARAAVQALGGK